MHRSSVTLVVIAITITLLILPVAQAADIELNHTCSIADAITAANTDTDTVGCPPGDGADTIRLTGNITLTAALPHITSDITIEGEEFTISGNNRFRIFAVNSGSLTVNNLTMTKGFADWGGAIVNVNGGTLEINDSELKRNWASEGGAIGNEGNLRINNSRINNNSGDLGGAIHHLDGEFEIFGSTFNKNRCEDGGCAIYHVGRLLKIINSVFDGHSGGDIIYNREGRIEITNSTFSNNKETAVWNENGVLVISNSVFSGNSTDTWNGGAIFNKYGNLVSITNSIFQSNQAPSKGGAVISWNGTLRIVNSYFTSNSAKEGAAVYNDEVLFITGSTFLRNRSSERGGAVYNESQYDEITISNSTFDSNSAREDGGALYIHENGEAILTHLTIVDNTAKRGGGLYRDAGAEVKLRNSIITGSEGRDCFGRLAENINNLIADGSCFTPFTGDPILGSLVEPEDGSPPYYPLLEGSPAIDAADSLFCPDNDITGTPRPQGDGCDIGAYELPQ
ncbi:MAG: hypothetical protein OXI40_11510 [Chloroflexota bacterium]|nr:hypothetical protein [Chloroflexota bacterium]